MMFSYLTTFVLIFVLPTTTLAIECLKCYQQLKLNSPDVLNTSRSECTKQITMGDMCMATLSIDFDNNTATTFFDNFPDQVLIFSNGNKITIESITIGLNKNITSQSVQSIGIDSAVGVEDINKTYNMMKDFKHDELRTKLRQHLYTPNLYVFDLTCSNNQNQTVDCHNGFCQLTRKGMSVVDRRCVPEGKGANPSGVLIESTNMEGPDDESTFSYACNKAMCNGAETDGKVQQLLVEYGLLKTKTPAGNATMTTLGSTPAGNSTMTTSGSTRAANSITTTLGSTTAGNSAMTTLRSTMMNFEWMLLLIITSLLKM